MGLQLTSYIWYFYKASSKSGKRDTNIFGCVPEHELEVLLKETTHYI